VTWFDENVAENSSLLRCVTVTLGVQFQAFQRIVVPSSAGSDSSRRAPALGPLNLKLYAPRFCEVSETLRPSTQSNVAEDLNLLFLFAVSVLSLIPHVSAVPTHPLQFRTEYSVKNASHIFFFCLSACIVMLCVEPRGT
jgi:hypothetical protein